MLNKCVVACIDARRVDALIRIVLNRRVNGRGQLLPEAIRGHVSIRGQA